MTITTMKQRSFWQWPETQGFALILIMAGSLGLTGVVTWTADIFSARLGELEKLDSYQPGMDLTLWLARIIASLPVVSDAVGLSIATSLAAPSLGIISYIGASNREGRILRTLLLSTHPLTLALVLTGAGWAAVGLYTLWRAISSLPRRRPHQGLAGSGLAIAFAWVTVPEFSAFLLPLAVTLFLCAPRHMINRFMVPYYLALFAPVAMLVGAQAYMAWAFETGWISTPLTEPITASFPVAALFTLCATLLSGPGLQRLSSMGGSGPRLAALLSSAFAASATGADPLTAASMAAIAQFALAARRGEPVLLSILSFAGGAAVVIGLGSL